MFGHREEFRGAVPYSGTVPVFLLALAFLITPACLVASGSTDSKTLPPGAWGGRGAEPRCRPIFFPLAEDARLQWPTYGVGKRTSINSITTFAGLSCLP